jgi:hypothetical protein
MFLEEPVPSQGQFFGDAGNYGYQDGEWQQQHHHAVPATSRYVFWCVFIVILRARSWGVLFVSW